MCAWIKELGRADPDFRERVCGTGATVRACLCVDTKGHTCVVCSYVMKVGYPPVIGRLSDSQSTAFTCRCWRNEDGQPSTLNRLALRVRFLPENRRIIIMQGTRGPLIICLAALTWHSIGCAILELSPMVSTLESMHVPLTNHLAIVHRQHALHTRISE